MFLLSLLLSTAGAAEIQVAMSFPAVIAVVDGVRQVNPNVTMFTDLTAGPHEVEVRNLIGNTLAKVDVTVRLVCGLGPERGATVVRVERVEDALGGDGNVHAPPDGAADRVASHRSSARIRPVYVGPAATCRTRQV